MDITKLDDKQFAVLFNRIVERIQEDPIENFVKAQGFMDFPLSAAQEVILKVIFQKKLDEHTKKLIMIESEDSEGNFTLLPTEMTEVEIYEFLTEKEHDPQRIEELKVNKINLICGRRFGKSTITAIIAIYCAISTNWKPFLSKTPYATALVMSHSKEFTEEILDIVKEFIKGSPVLTRLINKDRKQTASAMNLAMPFIVDNRIEISQVQIKVGAASSKTTRGVAACVVIADEICWWNLDENMKESDAKVMKAVRPALKQFGKHGMLIKLSSPAIKLGVLYDEYVADRNGTLPDTYAVFKAPSWFNTFIPPEEFIEDYLLDPEGFDTEYRANFADSLSNFITPETIDIAVQKGVTFLPCSESKSIKYFAAIDAAFKKDRFTFSVVGVSDNRIVQFISKGWEGTRKNPVRANDVAAWIKNAIKDYPVDYVGADQFAFQPLKEIFENYGIALEEYTYTNTYKKKIYFNLKNLIHRQQLDLLDNEKQTKELKELVVEQSTTGTIRIGHPAGGSDDYADSLAVACLLATEGQTTGKFEFDAMSIVKTYGVKTDINGVAFTAPSPEMLVLSGHLPDNVTDNSGSYGHDPDDNNKLKRFEDWVNPPDEDGDGFDMCLV